MASSSAAAPPAKTITTPSAPSTASGTANARQRVGPNGVSNRPKSRNEAKPVQNTAGRESSNPDKHAHDRILFIIAAFAGHTATITTKHGEQYTGVFAAAASTDPVQYVLRMTKRVTTDTSQQANGSIAPSEEYVGEGEDHTMVFDLSDVADLYVPNVSTDKIQAKTSNGITGSFMTDTDISGNLAVRERELQAWQPSADTNMNLGLNGAGSGTWDQFETNERLYGVKTDYDESFYTTTIDRSHPSYRERAAAADRLAREIEGTATSNTHVAEERGLIGQSEEDEETRFSGVRRDFPPLSSQSNRYTPPARRAPTGQPTVPGAPVDPAIISSQLAKPDTSKSNTTSPVPASSSNKENAEPAVSSTTTAQPAAAAANADSPKNVAKDVPTLKPLNTGVSATNATSNVENDVLESFKNFSANEKLKMQERQRASVRKEREVKLNDLKSFSHNFKLKTVVPEDMLDILAKDKQKQDEIKEDSQRSVEVEKEKEANKRANSIASDQQASKVPVVQRPDTAQTSPAVPFDRQNQKNIRPPPSSGFQSVRGDRSMQLPELSPRPGPSAPGNLANRLQRGYPQQQQQHQQYRDRHGQAFSPVGAPDARGIPAGPAAINTDINVARNAGIQTPSSSSSRFNVQAMEFRPNPAASTFQPSAEQSTGTSSPARPLTASSRPVNRAPFFGDKKPKPVSERRTIRDAFNPIKRLKQENTKDYASNGGIPQAYRTGPLWEAPEANANKSWREMFEKIPTGPAATMPGNAMPHQHQLPPHLQPGQHPAPQGHSPHQSHHAQPQFGHARDPHFDDHRMHPSSSNSSVYPSPSQRFQQPMMAYQNQMMGQMQPGFVQPQYAMGPNGQPMGQMRQFGAGGGNFANAGGLMATPMMPNNSTGGGSFGGMQMSQMPMYSPNPGHVLPAHVGAHTPGPGGMHSPQRAPMMMHQNSQQGPQYVYMNAGQHPGQMFPQQQQLGPMQQARGGFPMVQQHSYGASPQMQHGFPQQQRGMQFGGQFGAQQQMHPNQMMMHVQGPASHMQQGGDHET